MIINTNLLKHPVNWAIVLLMLLIAAYGGHLLLANFGFSAALKVPGEPNRNDIASSVIA